MPFPLPELDGLGDPCHMAHITPNAAAIAKIETLRLHFRQVASVVVETVPAGRERALSLTNLEQALMWGVKQIVLQQQETNAAAAEHLGKPRDPSIR